MVVICSQQSPPKCGCQGVSVVGMSLRNGEYA
jgi:hypothetical protein